MRTLVLVEPASGRLLRLLLLLLLLNLVHLQLYLLFPVHRCLKGGVQRVDIVLPDILIRQRLPVYSVPNWLSRGPKSRKGVEPDVGAKDLPEVAAPADIPLALEWLALLLQIFDCGLVLQG